MQQNREEKAVALFEQGYNCAQAVFTAYADLFGIDETTALKLSASFGGGMGRMREVCGAVSGMFMVCGLVNGSTDPADRAAKAANYAKVQELAAAFKAQNSGSILCRDLLAAQSVRSAEGSVPTERTASFYHERPCVKHIRQCARLIENLLLDDKTK